MTFGDVIKAKRKELKLTQRKLADRVGVDFTYISKIVREGKEMNKDNFRIMGNLPEEDYKKIKKYVEELEFKRKVGLPEKAKPITSYEGIYGLGEVINNIPLCPHCGEWSYYTDGDAKRNGGYTVCPFCEKLMYMEEFFENK